MPRPVHRTDARSAPLFDPEAMAAAREFTFFLGKNRRRNFIPTMRKLVKKHPDIAGDFVWLHAHEMQQFEEEWAIMALFALLQFPDFSAAQRRRSEQAAAAALERVMSDMAIPDAVKAGFLPVLSILEETVDEEKTRRYFRDYDDAVIQANQKIARNVSDTPEELIKIMELHGFDPENAGAPSFTEEAIKLFQFGHNVSRINPAGTSIMGLALALGAENPHFANEQAQDTLDLIHESDTPRARWCLETLAQWPGFAKSFRNKAASLAGRGQKAQGPAIPGELSHCLVSVCDGVGSRTIAIFHRTPAGEFDAVNMMLNDEVGIKDAFAVFEDGSDMEDALRSDPENLAIATASLAFLRDLLADALARHEELGTPPPGRLFALLPYLGEQPIVPRRREPNLGAYMLETHRLAPALAEGGEALARSAIFGCLQPSSDAAYDFCRERMGKRGYSLNSEAFEAFLREIMPLERDRLLHRMAINLEVEALAGRAATPDNQTGARLWLGIKENVLPLEKIPFIRKLAAGGVNSMIHDIRNGCLNSREALEATMPWEQPLNLPVSLPDFMEMSHEEREHVFESVIAHFFGEEDAPAAPTRRRRGRAKETEKPAETKQRSAPARADGTLRQRKKTRRIYRLAVKPVATPTGKNGVPDAAAASGCEVEIAGDQSLSALHAILAGAFPHGGDACEFRLSGTQRFTLPPAAADAGEAVPAFDALDLAAGQTFRRLTGGPDAQEQEITVLDIGVATPRRKYPRLLTLPSRP